MLLTVLISVLVFLGLFAAMAIGVIVANKPVKGSCGGLSAIGMEGECEICGGNKDQCDEENERTAGSGTRAAQLGRNALSGNNG